THDRYRSRTSRTERRTDPMRIEDLMTQKIATCPTDSPLNEVARQMWDHDCGFVPLTASGGQRLRGVVTDRDICMAAYTMNRPLTDIRAESIMRGQPESCRPEDDVSVAHRIMRSSQVRRLPVVDKQGDVVGIVSLNDLALSAIDRRDEAARK